MHKEDWKPTKGDKWMGETHRGSALEHWIENHPNGLQPSEGDKCKIGQGPPKDARARALGVQWPGKEGLDEFSSAKRKADSSAHADGSASKRQCKPGSGAMFKDLLRGSKIIDGSVCVEGENGEIEALTEVLKRQGNKIKNTEQQLDLLIGCLFPEGLPESTEEEREAVAPEGEELKLDDLWEQHWQASVDVPMSGDLGYWWPRRAGLQGFKPGSIAALRDGKLIAVPEQLKPTDMLVVVTDHNIKYKGGYIPKSEEEERTGHWCCWIGLAQMNVSIDETEKLKPGSWVGADAEGRAVMVRPGNSRAVGRVIRCMQSVARWNGKNYTFNALVAVHFGMEDIGQAIDAAIQGLEERLEVVENKVAHQCQRQEQLENEVISLKDAQEQKDPANDPETTGSLAGTFSTLAPAAFLALGSLAVALFRRPR